MTISEAFFSICKDAKPIERAKSAFVTLYVDQPFYGGPEEGGWWGHDTIAVASHELQSIGQAESVAEAIRALAAQLTLDARKSDDAHCARQCDWLEARGLDADFLPEIDGPARYWVAVEDIAGDLAGLGGRFYE